MKSREHILYFSLILLLFVLARRVHSVPHEFCFDNFNDTDCGEVPKDVVYYYKPGSRCEVRQWRGCPTLNKFPDIFSCQHFCVMRMGIEVVETVPDATEVPHDFTEELEDLNVEDMEIIDQILDDVIQGDHVKQKLVYIMSTEESSTTPYTTSDAPEIGEIEEVVIT